MRQATSKLLGGGSAHEYLPYRVASVMSTALPRHASASVTFILISLLDELDYAIGALDLSPSYPQPSH